MRWNWRIGCVVERTPGPALVQKLIGSPGRSDASNFELYRYQYRTRACLRRVQPLGRPQSTKHVIHLSHYNCLIGPISSPALPRYLENVGQGHP